ncbi:MAG: cupin domain-containing protein, partial [Candidatus Eiseniibacteriota bacterium]
MEHFCDLEKRKAKEVIPGVLMRTFWGSRMLLAIVDLAPNVAVPAHSHPHEQVGTIVSGQFELTIAGETRLLGPGDAYLIPADTEHSGKTGGSPARVMDVF